MQSSVFPYPHTSFQGCGDLEWVKSVSYSWMRPPPMKSRNNQGWQAAAPGNLGPGWSTPALSCANKSSKECALAGVCRSRQKNFQSAVVRRLWQTFATTPRLVDSSWQVQTTAVAQGESCCCVSNPRRSSSIVLGHSNRRPLLSSNGPNHSVVRSLDQPVPPARPAACSRRAAASKTRTHHSRQAPSALAGLCGSSKHLHEAFRGATAGTWNATTSCFHEPGGVFPSPPHPTEYSPAQLAFCPNMLPPPYVSVKVIRTRSHPFCEFGMNSGPPRDCNRGHS